jgi:diguanylate cyclase (GGDEF)-like protein
MARSVPRSALFGARQRAPKPVLLLIVFGVLLGVVGITATAQALMVTVYATSSTLNAIVQNDVATIRGFIQQNVSTDIVEQPGPTAAQLDRLNELIATLVSKDEILRVDLRTPDGHILASSDAKAGGTEGTPSAAFGDTVTAATPHIDMLSADQADVAPGSLPTQTVLRELLPLRQGDQVVLVAAIWRDATPILSSLEDLRRDVVIVTITAAILAAVILYVVFRSAQGRLTRQTEALLEAGRRDALTGTLNHGALVGHLAQEIERARGDGEQLGVALIDIDGFRLLNDNHGHRAGDDVLLAVARILGETMPAGTVLGRYGPDEYLVIAQGDAVEGLVGRVEDFRTALAGFELQFESTERLPVTVSASVCRYPLHGDSVTVLLSSSVSALEDAKASGGDSVVVAGDVRDEQRASASSFDVLQGLVFAVDTKDRYTKRHSEDVARYATFIAEQAGMDEAFIRTLRLSGLLHDVGKIGIPDSILRKPGRLTAEEQAVIQQHVVLGDSIVRELPDIELVRAGVRHHHERWDGRGYLDALAGEDIPLVARILAVADVFSAMTTTRPYRKALDLREALARLGDAAGTQLDERFVSVFINGLETAPNAPLPGQDVHASSLWTPMRRAA